MLKALHKHSVFDTKTAKLQKSLTTGYYNFTGHDTTLLEDWLVDIETAAHLMTERRTKLAQAKLKGLTCTIITDAIMSGNSWDDIKDLL